MSSYAQEEEVDINDDEDLEIGSLSDQQSSGLVDKARKVRFAIKKAEVRTQYDEGKKTNPWTVKRLSVQAKISEDGIDGQGAFAGRVLFPEFILAFNSNDFADRFASDWWQKSARGPAKDFLASLGFDPAAPPRINKDFLDGLIDMEFLADILQKEQEEKTDEINPKTGKPAYRKTGEFKNDLANFRQV